MSERFLGLEEISIRNLGVIESALVEFKPGLNVLSGETGAGKTMVLTALSLILGGKSDLEKVRTGTDRMVVTGRFSISPELEERLEEIGPEIESGSLLVSRTVTADGKSRLNIGGIPTTASKVAEISSDLVEVHAQSSTSRLTKSNFARDSLDRFGSHMDLLARVGDLFRQHVQLAERINQLQRDQRNRELEISRLTEFMKAFSLINPKIDELSEIENELIRLSSVEELQQATAGALNILDGEEFSVNNSLVGAKRLLDHVAGKDPILDEISQGMGDALFAFQEAFGALQRYSMTMDADPIRLDFLQERKSGINVLIKKFGEGDDKEFAIKELIHRAKESSGRIADLEGGSERIQELNAELDNIFKVLRAESLALSKLRKKTALTLAVKITDEIRQLAMPHGAIEIHVAQNEGLSISDFNQSGLDEVSLLFTSHEGATPGMISKVASGGELSRIMLAIEVVLASINPVQTYVFDEVDAGVGGKAAVEVGRRLRRLAEGSQVIVVTHLAQVAVWANNHLVVQKNESGSVSVSDVIAVEGSSRSVEIARMLSGQENSVTAREHAQELLEMVAQSVIS